jgi:PAS domain S-box-containing protein
MQNQKVIEQLGYSSKEAKVYLASLGLGEAHISDIATKVKMPRSTVQVIVERLREDGLMNFYIMRRYKYWVAEKPEKLLEMLKKREETVEAALPELAKVRHINRNKNEYNDSFYVESLKLLESCSEASNQPTLITNSDVEIVFANTAWQQEFGYSLEEVRGENPRILKSGQTPQVIYDDMWSKLKFDKLFQSDAIIDKRKDGALLNLLTTIFGVRHGNRKFYIQILNDITDKQKAETLQQTFKSITV